MKRSTRFSLLFAGVCAVLPLTGLYAQDAAAPSSTPSVAVPAGPTTGTEAGQGARKGRMKAAMAALTPDERKELIAARQKAMQDPMVQQAKADKKGLHRAMHEAMLKADPNIKPILDKMHASMGGQHTSRKDLQTN